MFQLVSIDGCVVVATTSDNICGVISNMIFARNAPGRLLS